MMALIFHHSTRGIQIKDNNIRSFDAYFRIPPMKCFCKHIYRKELLPHIFFGAKQPLNNTEPSS